MKREKKKEERTRHNVLTTSFAFELPSNSNWFIRGNKAVLFPKRGGWGRNGGIVCKFARWKRAATFYLRAVSSWWLGIVKGGEGTLAGNIHKIEWPRVEMRGATDSHVFRVKEEEDSRKVGPWKPRGSTAGNGSAKGRFPLPFQFSKKDGARVQRVEKNIAYNRKNKVPSFWEQNDFSYERLSVGNIESLN